MFNWPRGSKGEKVHRTYYQRPGCLGWTAFFFMALCLAGVPSRLVAKDFPDAERVVYFLSVVLIMWVLSRLFRFATSTTRAVCPHCGVDTDPQFRVCRSCGRVKSA